MSHPVHLILLPDARIVTRNDANQIGGGPLVPAGAVAVITDSPADAQHPGALTLSASELKNKCACAAGCYIWRWHV
jgi:hypothetical protein